MKSVQENIARLNPSIGSFPPRVFSSSDGVQAPSWAGTAAAESAFSSCSVASSDFAAAVSSCFSPAAVVFRPGHIAPQEGGVLVLLCKVAPVVEGGGEPGDLYLYFQIEPHKLLKRQDKDLYVTVPISYRTAVLGGKIQVPGIDDTLELTVPAGTASGTRFWVQ